MRVVYIHQYFRTRNMAGGTRSYEQARRLVALGHEVAVVSTTMAPSGSPLSWRTTVEDGIQVHWLCLPYSNRMSFRRRILAFLWFAAGASVKATRLGGDVVFATSTPLTVAIPGMIAARLRRARFVFEVRDLWPEVPVDLGVLRNPILVRLAYALARAAYRNADQVVALSPGMAAGVAVQGCPTARITTVPNAADLDLFASAREDGARFRAGQCWLGDRPLVVYLGTFGRVNGLAYLVRLAAALRPVDPEVRFLLVGDGAEREALRGLADRLGVLDTTLFLRPPVPKATVPAILGAATVATSVVLPVPSLVANSANKFFDALAAGCPVALNYGGWQAELLRETGAGVQLHPTDVRAAAGVLRERLEDRGWLDRAGRAARRLAVERFSRDALFDRLLTAVLGEAGGDRAMAMPRRGVGRHGR
jgi:glycosyltransferase involved in cell wall biosynthesis